MRPDAKSIRRLESSESVVWRFRITGVPCLTTSLAAGIWLEILPAGSIGWGEAWPSVRLLARSAFSASPAVSRPGAKAGLWLAGLYNLAVALGFARLARS